jgi:hypothetical protein
MKSGRFRAEQLHPYRPLFVGEFGVFPRPAVGLEDALGGDELGDHHVGAELLAEVAENEIRHPRHRREEQREPVMGEPREHG